MGVVRFDTGDLCSARYELGFGEKFLAVLIVPADEALEAKRRGGGYRVRSATLTGEVRWHDPPSGLGVAYRVEFMDTTGRWRVIDEFDLTCGITGCDDPMTHTVEADVTGLMGNTLGIQLVRVTRTDFSIPLTAGTSTCLRLRGEYEVW